MLSTLVLAALLIQHGFSTLLRLQLALISDNQGNVFALLNQNTTKVAHRSLSHAAGASTI